MPETKYCGNRNCGTSTGICGSTTHGYGELDQNGYWYHPCFVCARHYERETGEPQWPFAPPVKSIEDKILEWLEDFGPTTFNGLQNVAGADGSEVDEILARLLGKKIAIVLTEQPGNANWLVRYYVNPRTKPLKCNRK